MEKMVYEIDEMMEGGSGGGSGGRDCLTIVVSSVNGNQEQRKEFEKEGKEGMMELEGEVDMLADVPGWTLRVEGRMQGEEKKGWGLGKVLKRMVVEVNQEGGEVVEWVKGNGKGMEEDDVTGFELKRKALEAGAGVTEVLVRMELDYGVERWKVGMGLKKVVGMDVGTLGQVVTGFWK
eukprot:TRINITY_DN1868_c3_g6_i2.p2 TRINITY_DN1868_c3_g6~~TRINITY_DN1868_c3_g6_i2.p2  ORF type:complete len:178 (-),score=55.52 TRINITY_DN1868_c3_g6_i2:59-592(-)